MQIVSLKDNFAWIIKAYLVNMRIIFQNVDCWILFLASSALNISRFHCNNKCGERRGKTTFWHVRPTKTQISLRIRAVWYESSLSVWRNFASWAFQNASNEDSDQPAQCAGWSESSLGAQYQIYIFCCWCMWENRNLSHFLSHCLCNLRYIR